MEDKKKPAHQTYGTPEHSAWCQKMRDARRDARLRREAAAKKSEAPKEKQ